MGLNRYNNQIKIDATDSAPDYLSTKLVAGTNITLTPSVGPNMTLTVAASGSSSQAWAAIAVGSSGTCTITASSGVAGAVYTTVGQYYITLSSPPVSGFWSWSIQGDISNPAGEWVIASTNTNNVDTVGVFFTPANSPGSYTDVDNFYIQFAW